MTEILIEPAITEVLEWYDGPVVFEARDKRGALYIGMSVEENGFHYFALFEVEEERMSLFKQGEIDLRSLILIRDSEYWYMWGEGAYAIAQSNSHYYEDILPDEGYYINRKRENNNERTPSN